jgi:hypothetical protein
MPSLYAWLVAYALPVVSAGAIVKALPRKGEGLSLRNGVIMHGALILSVVASQYLIHSSGLTFPWQPKALSIFAYVSATVIAAFLIGATGLWYALSAFVQELTIVSITFLLLPALPLYLIILIVVPVFVWAHTLRTRHWYFRLILLATWGVISVSLFSIILDVYLLAALHALLGAMLISRSVILRIK